MNICILSNKGGNLDEGQKNVAYHFSNELSKRHEVYHVNAKANIFSKKFWVALRQFKPDIIHVFLRPNTSIFLYGKVLQFLCRGVKVVISALQPPLNPYLAKILIPLLKIDMLLTLSKETDSFFASLGCKTSFFGCGVDTEKFVPAKQEKKLALKGKYEISKNKFVILHVGSITYGRNLRNLVNLQSMDNNQVVIVANTTFKPDPRVYRYLRDNGCIIFRKYFEHIEEIYQLADCYIFPTLNPSNCIELPLSILEAMSCNLPVITTRFGAITRIFNEGKGLVFIDNKNDIFVTLNIIKSQAISIQTRKKVICHTWGKAAQNLENIYTRLLGGELENN